MTSTTPNRSYFWTGTVRDEQHADSSVYMRNEDIERGGMIWKTYPERLQEAGITWKFYQNELTNSGLAGEEDAWLGNFGCSLLECFAAYNVEAYSGFAPALQAQIADIMPQTSKLEDEVGKEKDPRALARLRTRIEHAQKRITELQAQLPDSAEARYGRLTNEQRALHHAACVTNAGDPNYRALESLPFEGEGKA